MGMTIDEAIKIVRTMHYPTNGDNEKERDTAIMLLLDTAKKYQKFQDQSLSLYMERLKTDMVAMLTDIKKEIDEIPINPKTSKEFKLGQATAYDKCEFCIQQKIDKLREGEL